MNKTEEELLGKYEWFYRTLRSPRELQVGANIELWQDPLTSLEELCSDYIASGQPSPQDGDSISLYHWQIKELTTETRVVGLPLKEYFFIDGHWNLQKR